MLVFQKKHTFLFAITLFSFGFLANAQAQDTTTTRLINNQYVFSTYLKDTKAKVEMTKGNFDVKQAMRRYPNYFNENGDPVKKFLGVDGGLPGTQINSLRVTFNGQEISIDPKFYTDCFNPTGSIDVIISDDRQSVFVIMRGSDAAGSYQVLWNFRPDGNHSRLTSDISDMGLFNSDVTSSYKPDGENGINRHLVEVKSPAKPNQENNKPSQVEPSKKQVLDSLNPQPTQADPTEKTEPQEAQPSNPVEPESGSNQDQVEQKEVKKSAPVKKKKRRTYQPRNQEPTIQQYRGY